MCTAIKLDYYACVLRKSHLPKHQYTPVIKSKNKITGKKSTGIYYQKKCIAS